MSNPVDDSPHDTKSPQYLASGASSIAVNGFVEGVGKGSHTEGGAEGSNEPSGRGLIYGIEDIPPLPVLVSYSIQTTLSNIGGAISVAFFLYDILCVTNDDVFFAELLSTSIFMMGLVTVLQCSVGVRLPVIQGSSFAFFPPIIAMMASPEWRCPEIPSPDNSSLTTAFPETQVEAWRPRINEISGSLAVASLVQVLLGCTGAIGFLMNYIGPLTITPTISLIGLALYPSVNSAASAHWGIAIMTCGLVVIFSLFLGRFGLPMPAWNKDRGWHITRFPLFKMFPFFLAMAFGWLLCYIFTITDVFPNDESKPGYRARTDLKSDMIHKAKWFYWPYPGQWGTLTVGLAMFVGLTAVTLTSVVESIGDYYATASMCDLPPPPKHAVNRGIMIEGLGSLLSGVMGAGHATSTYSGSVSFIGVTKMGSRINWILTGFVFMLLGVFGKFGAVMASLPDPVIGGMNLAGMGLLVSVGLTNLRFLDTTNSRNMMILGVSLMLGMTVPFWLNDNPGAIQTGSSVVDQLLTVFLSTHMFIGGLAGFILDNLVPGTLEERGIKAMLDHLQGKKPLSHSLAALKSYDIPFISDWLRAQSCFSYVPFLPSFLYKKDDNIAPADEVYRL